MSRNSIASAIELVNLFFLLTALVFTDVSCHEYASAESVNYNL